MSGRIDEFIKSQNKDNRNLLNIFNKLCDLGYGDDFLDVYKKRSEIEQIILDLHPTSERSITTIRSLIGSYARFIGNKDAYRLIMSIDRKLLWEVAKKNAPQKYISHDMYLDVLHDIETYENNNSFYYQMLFRVIYEGIFCDDMSVIANLRASDIHGNVIELHRDDGYLYKMMMPTNLIEGLKELADLHEWERRNGSSASYTIKVFGRHHDSCFKIENRKGSSKTTYRFGYYNKLRKVFKEYVEADLTPKRLFISGIMYRIYLELQENNISIEDAFSDDNRNRTVMHIIEKELSRCEYNIPVKTFREHVVGHLETFTS